MKHFSRQDRRLVIEWYLQITTFQWYKAHYINTFVKTEKHIHNEKNSSPKYIRENVFKKVLKKEHLISYYKVSAPLDFGEYIL